MKKLLACLIALTLMLTMLAACGGKENTDENTDDTTAAVENETKEENNDNGASDKIINDDGEEFIVDITTKGSIKEGAASINDSKLVLCGKEYSFPIKVATLMADGWSVPESVEIENTVPAESAAMTNGIYMVDGNGNEILISEVYNELTEEAAFEDCIVTGIKLDIEWEDITDFVIPGGIVAESTAADVLAVFGNPNTTDEFEYGYNLDDQLSYENNNDSGLTYHFTFNEDGSLYSISMNAEK